MRRVQARNRWVFEPDERVAAFLVAFDVRSAGSPLGALVSWRARRYHAYAIFLTERNLYVCRRVYFRVATVRRVEARLPVGTFRTGVCPGACAFHTACRLPGPLF